MSLDLHKKDVVALSCPLYSASTVENMFMIEVSSLQLVEVEVVTDFYEHIVKNRFALLALRKVG